MDRFRSLNIWIYLDRLRLPVALFRGKKLDLTGLENTIHDHSMIIPRGIHDVHGTTNWLRPQPTLIPWIPHGFHMD